MADIDFGKVMDAGRNLIDNPPPGFVVDMHPSTVSAWLEDGTRDTLAAVLVKRPPETRASVSAVVLTSGLNRAMEALTGAGAAWNPGDTMTTPRELRLAAYANRLADAVRNLIANRPSGFIINSRAWDRAKVAAEGVVAELGQLGQAPPTMAEAVGRVFGEPGERPVSTIPNIDPRAVAGEYIAGRVPLILPDVPQRDSINDSRRAAGLPLLHGHDPADTVSHAEAEAVLDSLGIRPTLPAGYEYDGRPSGAGGNHWQQVVRTWNGQRLVAFGETPRAAVRAAVEVARRHHNPAGRVTAEESFGVGPDTHLKPAEPDHALPDGYRFAGNAQGVHAPGPWTHYVDDPKGKRLYGHGMTPDEARADAVRVAKNHAAAAADSNGADIVDALRMRFDAQIVFPDEVARRAAAEIERLRRELAEANAARKVTVGDAGAVIRQRDDARRELADLRKEVAGVLDKVPNALRIDVRPGAGAEDMAATLALTVANVVMMHDKATDYAAELREQLTRESAAVGKLRDELQAAQSARAQAVGELATARGVLHRREETITTLRNQLTGTDDAPPVRAASETIGPKLAEPYPPGAVVLNIGTVELSGQGVRLSVGEPGRLASAVWVGGQLDFRTERGRVIINYAADHVAEAMKRTGVRVELGAAGTRSELATQLAQERERSERMRAEAVFFGARNSYYRAALAVVCDTLGNDTAITSAGQRAHRTAVNALKPDAGPKRQNPGPGDRGPDLLGELLAYREAVADVLTGLDAFDRQPGRTPEPVRVAIDTLRTVTDLSATPRQMAGNADGQPALIRALEDAQAQLAQLRQAVAVAGLGIVMMPGAVRLQDMRPEPADDDGGDGDIARTPMSDSEPHEEDSRTEEHPADAANRELSSQLRAMTDRANGLRALLNFAELRARGLAWLLVNVNRADGGDGDRAADVLRTLEQMGRTVRATLTANAQKAGFLTCGQFAAAASAQANELRLILGERDHVPADFYALPLGFTGPEDGFRF